MLALMDRLFSQTRMIKPQFVKGTLTPVQWLRARDYCDVHLAEKITLEELAALCCLERFHFLKLFKQTPFDLSRTVMAKGRAQTFSSECNSDNAAKSCSSFRL